MQRNPACVAAHHLHDEHAVVAFRCGYQLVKGLRGDLHRRLETEGEVRARQVVVDGLGHAHHGDAHVEELQGDALRAVAADVDESVEAHVLETFLHQLRTVFDFPASVGLPHGEVERAALVGGLDDGAALDVQAGDHTFRQFHNLHVVFQDAVERLYTAVNFPFVLFQRGSFHDAADHRVQPGTVAAARGH